MEQHHLKISSKSENLARVEKLIDDICDTYNIGENNYGNILIALTEAVNNAIVHGNKSNPDKEVEISFDNEGDWMKFSIKDEGEGFNFESLPDPTSPENIEKPSGRGIFLMKNLADEVEFEDEGRTVLLNFKLSVN